jgi:hypothetical protein
VTVTCLDEHRACERNRESKLENAAQFFAKDKERK